MTYIDPKTYEEAIERYHDDQPFNVVSILPDDRLTLSTEGLYRMVEVPSCRVLAELCDLDRAAAELIANYYRRSPDEPYVIAVGYDVARLVAELPEDPAAVYARISVAPWLKSSCSFCGAQAAKLVEDEDGAYPVAWSCGATRTPGEALVRTPECMAGERAEDYAASEALRQESKLRGIPLSSYPESEIVDERWNWPDTVQQRIEAVASDDSEKSEVILDTKALREWIAEVAAVEPANRPVRAIADLPSGVRFTCGNQSLFLQSIASRGGPFSTDLSLRVVNRGLSGVRGLSVTLSASHEGRPSIRYDRCTQWVDWATWHGEDEAASSTLGSSVSQTAPQEAALA